jgi:hypothetical protein
MQDEKDGPLSSRELEEDAAGTDRPSLKPGDAPGHTLPESEAAAEPEPSGAPSPIGGTMLPPD